MGRKKGAPVARRKPILSLEESTGNSQGPSVDPYRQTTAQLSSTYKESEASGDSESSSEANAKLKNLLNEIHNLSSRNLVEEEPMNTEEGNELPTMAAADPIKTGALSSEPEAMDSSEDGITFWKQVTDPKTNHAYYWNPKTNEVSWTLPNNGVIADDTPDLPSVSDESNMEADNPYVEYYTYYKQAYGKTESSNAEENDKAEETAQNDNSKASVQSDFSTPTTVKPKPKKSKKKIAAEESNTTAFVGPILPASAISKPTAQSHDHQVTEVTENESTRSGVKRKASTEESPIIGESLAENDPAAKKPRLKGKSLGGKKSSSPLSGMSPQAEQALRFQVSNMADELTRKLDYLHVTNEGLSDIQLLNIQLQTRLSDWKEGGINTKFMLSKLKTSAVSLTEYEQSAAPEGWKIVWDGSSCRYQYHNLSTGETTWQYPMQLTDSNELSGQEESSDNEAAPESPVPQPVVHPTSKVAPSDQRTVIGPIQPPGISTPSDQPAMIGPIQQSPPVNSVTTSQVAPSNQPPIIGPTQLGPSVTTSEVVPSNKSTGPQSQALSSTDPKITAAEDEGPTKEQVTTGPPPARHYKTHEPPPPPPPKSELTVEKVREKLYPSLRPRRSRESLEHDVPLPVPELAPKNETEEPPPPPINMNSEGVEFISEFPITTKNAQSAPASNQAPATTSFDVGIIKSGPRKESEPKSKVVPPTVQQSGATCTAESEARLRERIVERQKNRIKFSVSGKDSKEDTLPMPSPAVSSAQPKPSQERVEQSTGEQENPQQNKTPTAVSPPTATETQQSGVDDSRVEPETGEVEPLPRTDSTSVPDPKLKATILAELYQDWTPSPSEGGEKSQATEQQVSMAKGDVTEEGEVSSESSSDSESGSEGESRDKAGSVGGKCYMDSEEGKEKRKSERYSDEERSSRRRKSFKRSRRDYSSEDSDDYSSRRDRHHRSHRHDDSGDEYSRRHSRSSHRSSKKNRSRSRSGHRRKRSHSRDSLSPHPSERNKKKSPRHKKSKKEKKEKKKKHHKERSDKDKDKEKREDDAAKPPPNVIVGKVGRISSKRTLGKDRKPSDEPDTPKTPGATGNQLQQPQAMSATYYQQPSTGQVPYYNMDPYYQGYYDPNMYQWNQGQWYGSGQASSAQANTGVVQYPTQYTSAMPQYTAPTAAISQYPATSTVVSTATKSAPSISTENTLSTNTGVSPLPASTEANAATKTPENAQYVPTEPTPDDSETKPPRETVESSQEPAAETEPVSESKTGESASQQSAQKALPLSELAAVSGNKTSKEEVVPKKEGKMQSPSVEATDSKNAATVLATGKQSIVEAPLSIDPQPTVEVAGETELTAESQSTAESQPSVEPVEVKSLEPPTQGESNMEVDTEEQITECDMDIDDNTPSPDNTTTQQEVASQEPTERDPPPPKTAPQDMVPPAPVEPSSKEINKEGGSPKEQDPPTLPEDSIPEPPPEAPPAPPPKEDNPPPASDDASAKPSNKNAEAGEAQPKSAPEKKDDNSIPTPSSPPTPPATTATSTMDYNAYMLAAQQQQAYNYAYATNNYVQAAYNAYVQQASAAAYQAYSAQYYSGYGGYPGAGYGSPYSAGAYYGAGAMAQTTTPTTGGGYGKVAYQLAQQAAATSTTESGDSKKSEFTLAGSKSKQMKSMMDKWSSFKEDDS